VQGEHLDHGFVNEDAGLKEDSLPYLSSYLPGGLGA